MTSSQVSPYSRLINQLRNDERLMKELTLGKRVGLYRFYGDLGTGNFSQVKLGVHQLTNGECRSQTRWWWWWWW